jgi:hypothetical protein
MVEASQVAWGRLTLRLSRSQIQGSTQFLITTVSYYTKWRPKVYCWRAAPIIATSLLSRHPLMYLTALIYMNALCRKPNDPETDNVSIAAILLGNSHAPLPKAQVLPVLRRPIRR